MSFYAHTAELPDGSRDPEKRNWQPLSTHLRNVAELAGKFAIPLAGSVGMERPTGFSPDRVSIMGISMFQSAPTKSATLKNVVDFCSILK